MTVSTIFPTMITKVIAGLGAATSLSGVRIFDGAEVDESYPGNAIAIGHDGSFGESEMQIGSVNNTPLDFTDVHQEDGVINCSLWAQSGSVGFSALRTNAFALLSAVDTVIRSDSTFGGTCFYAILGTHSVNYRQTAFGSAVVIDFSIAYQAQS